MLPRSSFRIRPLLTFSLLSLRTSLYFLQPWAANVSKITRFLAELPLFWHFVSFEHLAKDVFYFEDSSYGPLIVHYFQVKFQLFFALPYCSILFVLCEQYSLSWIILIVVCPNGQGEGSRVSLENVQSTVLRRASVIKHLHFQNI